MSNVSPTIENYPKPDNHKVFLFYPFYYTDKNQKYIENLPLRCIAEVLYPTDSFNISYAEKIWQKKEKVNLSNDLILKIQNIFNSNGSLNRNITQNTISYSITAQCKNLLSGVLGKKGKGLEIDINKTAKKRLGIDSGISLFINDITLFIFGSGVCILLIEIMYPDADINTIIEGNYVAARTSSFKQIHNLRIKEKDSKEFTFETLAKKLLSFISDKEYKINLSRIFTYSALSFKEALPKNRDFSLKLARHYTSDYKVSAEELKSGFIESFDTVLHYASLEGGTVIVENSNTAKALEGFINDQVPNVYLPIVIVAYHEYLYLTKKLHFGVDVDVRHPDNKTVDEFKKYRDDILNFRLNYHVTHVSLISMHNDAYNVWREKFLLDKLYETLSADVHEVTTYISTKIEEKRNSRWDTFSIIHATIGIFFGTMISMYSTVGVKFIELISGKNITTTSDKIFLLKSLGLTLFAALFIAAIYLFLVWRIKKK